MQPLPIHPIFVHFPVAFYFLEMVMLIAWSVKKDAFYWRVSRVAFGWGYGLMFAAIAAGLWDIGGPANIRGTVRTHVLGASVVLALTTVRAFHARAAATNPERHRALLLAGAVAVNIAVLITGYFGGLLAFQ